MPLVPVSFLPKFSQVGLFVVGAKLANCHDSAGTRDERSCKVVEPSFMRTMTVEKELEMVVAIILVPVQRQVGDGHI